MRSIVHVVGIGARLQERARTLRGTSGSGHRERSPIPLERREVHFWAVLQHRLDALHLVVERRLVQCRRTLAIAHVHVCTVVEQVAHHLHLPAVRGDVQGRCAVAVADIGVSTVLQ